MQFVLFGLCSLIALIVCMCILIFTANSVKTTESAQLKYDSVSKTELKNEVGFLSDYFNKLTDNTLNNPFVKVDTYLNASVEDSSVIVSDFSSDENCGTDAEIFNYAKNKIFSQVQGFYPENLTGVFGEISSEMPTVDFSEASVLGCDFTVGLTDENGKQILDDTGEVIDNEFYYLTFNIDYDEITKDKNLLKYFSIDETKSVKEEFIKEISSVCDVRYGKATPVSFTVTAKINRFNDKIDNITFDGVYAVEATVKFIDKLEVFGTKEISFEYNLSKTYEYSYAGIDFSESSVTLEPGDEIALSVNAVIENDSEYEVSFKSSDETVATVDEMGYVKGIKESDEPIIITVTLKYLNEVFTDECEVLVGKTNE